MEEQQAMFDNPPTVTHRYIVTRTEAQLISIIAPKGATPTTAEIYDKAMKGRWVSTLFKVDPLNEENASDESPNQS